MIEETFLKARKILETVENSLIWRELLEPKTNSRDCGDWQRILWFYENSLIPKQIWETVKNGLFSLIFKTCLKPTWIREIVKNDGNYLICQNLLEPNMDSWGYWNRREFFDFPRFSWIQYEFERFWKSKRIPWFEKTCLNPTWIWDIVEIGEDSLILRDLLDT